MLLATATLTVRSSHRHDSHSVTVNIDPLCERHEFVVVQANELRNSNSSSRLIPSQPSCSRRWFAGSRAACVKTSSRRASLNLYP